MARATYIYEPDYAVPPGEILEEQLQALQMSQAELARRCNRSPKLISEIVSGRAPVEPATAVQLEKALGLDARIWLGVEADYRLFLQREAEAAAASKKIAWAKNFPLYELVKRGVIERPAKQGDWVGAVLRFFGVDNVDVWESNYGEKLPANVAFRHSPSFNSDKYVLATWLRLGELAAGELTTEPYDKASFILALKRIRSLTAGCNLDSIMEAQRLCGETGVALTIIKPFPRMSLHAATRWISPQKALIQLTARHLRDDQLWFSFFHEAAHILLHGKRGLYVKTDDNQTEEDERAADRWAADFLIPRKDWGRFSDARIFDAGDVCAFADRQGIAPGIVVGRLQREKKIPYSVLNHLKTKLEWGG